MGHLWSDGKVWVHFSFGVIAQNKFVPLGYTQLHSLFFLILRIKQMLMDHLPLNTKVRLQLGKDPSARRIICLLAESRWLSSGTPVSSIICEPPPPSQHISERILTGAYNLITPLHLFPVFSTGGSFTCLYFLPESMKISFNNNNKRPEVLLCTKVHIHI